jgi:hypothetical protein
MACQALNFEFSRISTVKQTDRPKSGTPIPFFEMRSTPYNPHAEIPITHGYYCLLPILNRADIFGAMKKTHSIKNFRLPQLQIAVVTSILAIPSLIQAETLAA